MSITKLRQELKRVRQSGAPLCYLQEEDVEAAIAQYDKAVRTAKRYRKGYEELNEQLRAD